MVNNPEDDEILFTGFNQDATSLAVGTKRVYRLYSLGSVDELQKLHEQSLEDCCVVERLFSSSLVTLVSQTAPRKLRVCHFQKGTEICHQSYSNTILAVRLNRLRLVVCMEQSLYIHNIRDMKLLHTIRDTPPNPQGLCDLTSDDLSYFAYPGSSKIGEINIFDAANLQASATIAAHEGVLAALKFNKDGSKLASASEKGTVIRVFSVPQGEKLFEFRRGVKRCVTIYSLAFSSDSLFLSASSNTETVHVFKLEHAKDAIKHSSDPTHSQPSPTGSTTSASSWLPDIKGLVGSAATYLPSQMTDMWSQDRAFAVAKLPLSGTRNVTAITKIKQLFRVLVASADGYLYVYNLDTTLGGECSLIKQHCILTTNFSSQPTAVPSAGASTVAGLGGSPSSKFTYAATVKGPATPGSAIVSGTPGSASGDDCAVSRSPGKAVPVAVPASPSTTSSGRGPTSPLSRQADEAFSDLSLLEEPPSAFSASPLSGGFHSAAGQAAAGDGGRKRDAMPSVARSTPKSHLQKEIDLTRSSNRKTSSNSCDDFGPDANSNSRIRLDDNDEFPPMTHETQP